MSFFEQCKQCSVMVGGGSGVLFQPMTNEYSYILTAKHNLYNDDNNDQTIYRYTQPKNLSDIHINNANIVIQNKYEHSTLDIAILKINKIEFNSPFREYNQPQNTNLYKLYGFPKQIREQQDKISYFDLKVGDITNFEITASNQEYFPKVNIEGCSGGGVFKEDGDNFYLVGIEYRMSAQTEEESANNVRVRFIYIGAFDEIIEQNSSELAPLYPPYMNDFNLLVDNIYLLNDYEEKRDLVRNRVKYLSKTHTTGVTPIEINNEFKNELLINGFDLNQITNSELWQMYLEFILLSIIVDSKECLSLDKIKDVYKKRKILFAKSERWVELKEDILKSDLRGLQKNSIVFIACIGDRRPNKIELTKR